MFDIQKVLSFFKKSFTRKDILLGLLIIFGYFLTRLINLDRFPIFSDEGIYIHWAKVAWHDASWRFISLTDGRQPLQTWATIPFLKLFPNNTLLAGRLFSVTAGFLSLVGIFTLLVYLFDKRTAFIGSFLYLVTPYFLFYERMALVDSAVNTAFIWILFLAIILAQTIRLDIAIILGLVSGLSLLAKSSVKLFVGSVIFGPILFLDKNLKKLLSYLASFSFLYLIAIILALVLYNIQRLSPFFHFVALKNNTFIMSTEELLATPLKFFFGNLWKIPADIFAEAGLFIPLIGVFGYGLIYKKDKKLFLFLLAWLIIPYLLIALVTKVLFPRYIMFFASLLLIPAAYFVSLQKNKIIYSSLLLLLVVSVGYYDYTILFDYKNIPFPEVDRGQYIEGWSAGWGAQEIVAYAREKAKEKPVILIAEGNFGMIGDVLDVLLKPSDRISITAYWPIEEKDLIANQVNLDKNYVFAVFPHRFEYPKNWPLKLVKRFDKPGNKSVIYFFELTK